MCDFVYNVGATNFRNSTLLRVVNAREFDRVPAQLMRWIMAGGKEAPGLVNRRKKQIKSLFFDGAPIPRPPSQRRRVAAGHPHRPLAILEHLATADGIPECGRRT